MNESEIELGERIYQKIIENNGLQDILIEQEVLNKEERIKQNNSAKIRNIILKLVNYGLLEKRNQGTGYFIFPSLLSSTFNTLKEYLNYTDEETKAKQQEKDKAGRKLDLEITNLKLQIIHQKQWFWKLVVGAIIVESVNLYFIFIF
jgi:hypothetical protein